MEISNSFENELLETSYALAHSGMHDGRERKYFQYSITESIELVSYDELVVKRSKKRTPEVILDENRPLVLLHPWLLAKPRHTRKYVELYLDKGFDVLVVSITVWKVLWPMIGAQVIATDLMEFLHEHEKFQPLLEHGFSAGNYLWSEALVKMGANMERYKCVMDRIRGQIFDSPPCVPPAFQKGFAIALFPNNPLLCYLFECAVTLQLFLFYNFVTKHIITGYETALRPPVKVPCLLFMSKDDPISPFEKNLAALDVWKSHGVQAQVKWWEKSQHVGHFVLHRSEYLDQLNKLLESAGLNNLKRNKRNLETSIN